MLVANGAPSPAMDELKRLQAQMNEITNALGKQESLLRKRGLGTPTQIIAQMSTVEAGFAQLSVMLRDEETEIGQLGALAETSAMINSSLDVDLVLANAMDEIIRLTGAERGYILLINDETKKLEFRIARDTTGRNEHEDISRSIIQNVIVNTRPLLTENASEDVRMTGSETLARFTLRSVMCVPLIYRETVIGAIYVDNRYKIAVFTERELNLLTAFANQTAIAIENAILYAQVQAALHEITQVKDLMDNIFASIGSGVISTDARDAVVTFNRAAGNILSSDPDTAIGQPLPAVLPPIGGDFEAQLRHVRETRQSVALETHPEVPARGQITLSIKLSPLQDVEQERQGVAMVLDDLTELREREEMLELMRRYLPEGMVENIDHIAQLARGGERREVTCMYISVSTFDMLQNSARAEEIMDLLNVYLETASDVIQSANGLVDKYMGSEIMVLFNTLLNPQPDHALRAVEAALDLWDALGGLDQRLGISPSTFCMGLHSGVATLGNVGAANRRSFTAIGDTINTAHRMLENAHAAQIIISDDTLRHAAEAAAQRAHMPRINFRALDVIQVKNREQPIQVYEVTRA